ncbi:MAG: amidohydrolase [Acidobacteria bacterium]|nr:amidohydrolase [Acidobacteriota bacterium]
MQTPWGEVPVEDAHVHFFSHAFFSSLAAQKADIGVEQAIRVIDCQPPPPDSCEFADRWREELDQHRVTRAVLIASVHGDEGSVAAAVRHCPDRFYGYFMCNPLAPDAPARVEGALAAGMQGLCLFPAMHRFSVHDERALRLIDMAAAVPGTLVFVHCGVLSVGVRKRLGLPSPFDMRYSNPIDVHAIALRYLRLPFVLPHFGAGFFREALMLADLCPNVYFDTSSSNSWIRYEGLKLREVFERALDVMGPEHLLFGTDSSFFPRGWQRQIFEQQVRIMQELELGVGSASAILGGNLRRLLDRNRA